MEITKHVSRVQAVFFLIFSLMITFYGASMAFRFTPFGMIFVAVGGYLIWTALHMVIYGRMPGHIEVKEKT